MAATPEQRVALSCPYCGGSLRVNTESRGQPCLNEDVPESIECQTCDADWEPDGTARTAAKWIEWPMSYARR